MEKHYGVKLDLAKLNKVAAVNLKGKNGNNVKCVVIPVEENNIFISDKGGIYLDLTAIAMKKENYGQTHLIKRDIPKEEREKMTEEELKNQPIIGALKPLKAKQAEVTETAEVSNDYTEDLPF